ncbi:membrane protease YdiL (CAAX protease family) [Aequitasia blattaphilus]
MTNTINTKQLLVMVFVPTIVFSSLYLLLGRFCHIPHLLLFCVLGTVVLVPMEIGMLLYAGKKETGVYSFGSVLRGQVKMPAWQVLIIVLAFVGIAGLLSAFVAPIENRIFADARTALLNHLPIGFDWTNYEYLKSFSRPILISTCLYYGIFNVLIGPITEELYFRGYLTSHYKMQGTIKPVLITILFSLYHFWLPFNNIFRILAFLPVAYISYKKKNISLSIYFHCGCNLFSTIAFTLAVLG